MSCNGKFGGKTLIAVERLVGIFKMRIKVFFKKFFFFFCLQLSFIFEEQKELYETFLSRIQNLNHTVSAMTLKTNMALPKTEKRKVTDMAT